MSLSSDGVGMTMPVQPAYSGGGYNNGSMWGGDWMAFIVLFLLFGMFGWGGFGGFGGFGGGGAAQGYATQADIQRGFDNQGVMNKLNGIEQGICSLGYDQLNQMNGINTNILQTGFGIQQAINQGTVANMQNTNAIQAQLSDCCCGTQRQIERGFCDTNYNLATNTSNIIQSAHGDTDRVLAKLDAMENARQQERIAALQAENQALKFQASQTTQNGFIDAVGNSIVARLQVPTPVPAYTVPNPNCCYSPCGNCA